MLGSMPKGDPVDTFNFALVAGHPASGGVLIMNPPIGATLTADQALVLAAWLVVVVCDDARFAEILAAVQSS